MEIDNDVKSDEVRKLVVELMDREKGNEMRKNVADLKKKAEEACTSPLGSSMWGVAMEIDNDVKSDEVRKLVVELMDREKGNEMRKNVADLKKKAEEACTSPLGSSMVNLEKIIHLMRASSSR
nr:7-deoxyloganetin glucosyltransferase-like [Tanacetum cinerariifolium]